MKDINQRIANLSLAKRAILEQQLKQKLVKPKLEQTIPHRANLHDAPLSFSQQQMWLLDQFEPGNPAYNRPTNICLTGVLNVTALEESLNEIVRRHEALRTSFPAVDGQPIQKIAPTLTLTLSIIDLYALPEDQREAQIQRLATEEAHHCFDLGQGPLLRAVLVRLSEQEHILLLTMHHIIFDGWSMGVLLKEIAALYEAFSTGKPSSLPELSIQYADFAHWQRQWLQGEVLESQLAYWKKQLGGKLPVLELPTDRPRAAVQTFRGAKQSLLLPKNLSESLKTLSLREGVTLFTTLLAAFQTLLHHYTGQDDIIVGTPIASRNRIETEKLIGNFINTLVFRTQVHGNLNFRQLLRRLREVAFGAYAHQELPFEKLVEKLQPERDLSRPPFFQVMFQLRIPNQTVEVQGLRMKEFEFDTGIVMLDLAMEVVDRPEGLFCLFKYNTDLFDSVTIQRLGNHFQTLLENIVANPEQRISQLLLLTDVDHKILSNDKQFSCFLIGQESLVVECAKTLLERGHQIVGIISTGALITDWAVSRCIPHIQLTDDLTAFLSQQPFDYLFSIYNQLILPKEILKLPRRCAINCHNALLPKYGGLHASSWAILHQEKTHGITYHVMTNMIDGGDILKQFSIEIAEDETAFTLNGKCYEAIINSFAQLIDEIVFDQVSLSKQHLEERTYFSASQKPSAGCLLSWNRNAHEIEALVRALDFGPYPNPLGLPKLAIGSDFVIVSELEVLDDLSKYLPGTITAIDSDLKISTASYDVALRQVQTIDGQSLSIPAELVTKFKLQIGNKFQDIELDRAKRIEKFEALLVKHENFWVERLATLQPIVLPYAVRTLPQSDTRKTKSTSWSIPHQVTTFLNRLGAWTQGNFLFAAFAAYLARLSQTCCFDIGLRDQLPSQLVGLEGLFAFNVPCRIDINYEQSFEEVFEAIQKQVDLVKHHKTYARDILVRYPALHSMVNQGFKHRLPVGIERVERLGEDTILANELTLIIPEQGQECSWIYDAEVFNTHSIARMLDQFTTFVQSIVADTNRCLAHLPLLSAQEHHKILVDWNQTLVDYSQNQCVHQLFEAQVERTPEAVAVVSEDEQLTYRQLNERVNQLARHLQQIAVGPEVLVGLCVERSLEMVVGLLGILKAGGAYVPLDPRLPQERLAYILSDSQVPVLLTTEKLLPLLPKHAAHIVCLDTSWDISQQSQENPLSSGKLDNLAYVIYTSGSTGKPKGVMIEHRSLVSFSQTAVTEYKLSDRDRVLQFASINFDTAVEEIYPCLISGGTLVLRTDEMLSSVAAFLQKCRDWQLTVLDLPTAYWHQITSELATADLQLPSSLRLVIIGGEEALPEYLKKWQNSVGNYPQLINTYGPTEATVIATMYRITSEQAQQKVPVGRAIANVQTYVLDQNLQPVPISIPGELHIGGDGLARGYLNRPELTAEKFILNPFSDSTYLYKTGDLVRYLPNGNIEFIGRIDHQVKIRGFRIELGEIEAVLAQHPQVREVVVIAREDTPGNKRLVAYVVPHQRTPILAELRGLLKQKLPDYMIPAAFVILNALPLTPNRKVDRRALPAPENIKQKREETFVAPRARLEKELTKIWEQVLGIQPVGITDNFFDLGGHSLLAMRLVAEIEKAFDKKLPLATLFQFSTVEQLVNTLDQDEAIIAPTTEQRINQPYPEASISKTSPPRPQLSSQDYHTLLAIVSGRQGQRPCSGSLMVAVQPNGSRPPLFFCASSLEEIALLAKHLPQEQPIYLLESGYTLEKTTNNIKAIAARHVEDICRVQPKEPYLLAGYSWGGIVAYEIAQQLQAQSKEVALLALLDRNGPQTTYCYYQQIVNFFKNNWYHLSSLTPSQQMSYLHLRVKRFLYRKLSTSRTNHQGQVIDSFGQNRKQYVPQPYFGQVTLFLNSENSLRRFLFPRGGWDKQVIPKLNCHVVPGDHHSLLKEPYVQVLAEKLLVCLEQGVVHQASEQYSVLSQSPYLPAAGTRVGSCSTSGPYAR